MTNAIKADAFRMNVLLPVLVAGLLFCAGSWPAHAKYGILSKEDAACLKCHAKEGYSKAAGAADPISLYVSDKRFSESIHNENGCTDCHTELEQFDLQKHKKANNTKIGTREYSIASVAVCRDCHKKNVKFYNESLHAALVREGNKEAPICTDCHDTHYVRKNSTKGPMEDVNCRDCHGKIYKAYAASVHGQARSQQPQGKPPAGKEKAPICADCHKSHEILAAATEGRIKDACLNCHKKAKPEHKVWLPNVERHFDAISCSVCHVATAKRRVDLKLYDTEAHQLVKEKQGVPQFQSRARAADARGVGLDALAVESLLREFNGDGNEGRTMLRGRLEVASGIETHQLLEKKKAIKDCDTCHREGSDVFQTVSISIARPDGRPLRHDAQKEVLTSPISVNSVRGFYAIGGTRIKLLDALLAMALIAGVTVPVGHMSLKWAFRKYLKKLDDERQAEQAKAAGRPSAGDSPDHPNTPQA